MKALISPNEPSYTGQRIAEVAVVEFEVAPPLFWVDCGADVAPGTHYFDPSEAAIKSLPPSPEPENTIPVTEV